MKKSNRAL